MTGLFITLEGGEGSGKSTLAAELAERLRKAGRAVTLTEEPGGSELGQHFWSYLRDANRPPLTPIAELLMFEAARAQHVETVVRPALEAGEVVICDRFTDSSVAYQGYGRELGRELVKRLNDIATGGLKPDLTLLLDVHEGEGLRRARSIDPASKLPDVIGEEAAEFHNRVRRGFTNLAQSEPGRIAVIDASQPLEAVTEAAWQRVQTLLSAVR